MIPKIIHYCWFGKGELPQLAKDCIASWHKYMPDWEYRLWNEDNFDMECTFYTHEAYNAMKYAFVSDFVRLKALYEEGGVYLDTDVEVFKPLEPLLQFDAFAGIEGSKHLPIGTCVMASVPKGLWIREQLDAYQGRHFIQQDGTLDFTTNVQFMSNIMQANGFVPNGKEQDYKDLHIFPVDYFSPRQTTGEYFKTENTYCEHKGLGSWADNNKNWKTKVLHIIGQKNMTRVIKLKRKILG